MKCSGRGPISQQVHRLKGRRGFSPVGNDGVLYPPLGMDLTELQTKLARLDGVEAVRVVGTDARPEEIHVLARMAKPPKQVVRDVQSLAAAAFGIDIDRRIVSVVQLADGDLSGGNRPAIVDIFETTDGSRSTVRVNLEWNDELLVGETSGAAATATRHRLVAEAVLAALGQALHADASFAVASVDIATLGSRKVAVAQVVLVTQQTERLMVGSSLVDVDESRAVVRAVLDALNRVVPDLRR